MRVLPARLPSLLAVVTLLAGCRGEGGAPSAPRRLKLGVLGDSDSHSYGDRVSFPPGSDRRGGPSWRASTLQWTEVLARLRPRHLDPGAWGRFGSRPVVALLRSWLGLDFRSPPKEDFAYNFAQSGATCDDLVRRALGQAQSLRRAIERDVAGWRDGIVVIRIGVADIGMGEHLERWAGEGLSPGAQAAVDRCAAAVTAAVRLIEEPAPQLRALLVGILDNADWPRLVARWQDPVALARIKAVLDAYDDRLRAIAAERPSRAFWDDRAWFRARWGGRGPDGRPAYRDVRVAGVLTSRESEGDPPENVVVADGHFSTGANALWAQAIVAFLDERFGAGIPPIRDDELAGLLRAVGAAPR